MIPSNSYLHLAHITFETRAPLSIGGGKPDGVFDVEIARDANGLPVIPGASLAGVLRHLFRRRAGGEDVDALFGCALGDQGKASRVHIGWAYIHDSQDKPLTGLVHPISDELLKPLLDQALPYRDHVRISSRGAAEDRGKFDRSFVPTGMRFTAELQLWSDSQQDPAWASLLALLRDPLFRLGGATRRGYGRLDVVRVLQAGFDLRTEQGLAALTALDQNDVLVEMPPPERSDTAISASIKLQPEAGWRFGAGSVSLARRADKVADALPVSEQIVEWNGEKGGYSQRRLVVPASSIKGALAHRVAYHYNRLAGIYASADNAKGYDKNADNHAVRVLFGYATDHNDGDGQAGRILIDDLYLKPEPKNLRTQMHNSVDRFTGGVRDKVLFSEENVYRTGIELRLVIAGDAQFQRELGADPKICRALALALEDLTEARLPLGAGSAKGHGYFSGQVAWSDGGRWITGENA